MQEFRQESRPRSADNWSARQMFNTTALCALPPNPLDRDTMIEQPVIIVMSKLH